MVLQRVGRQDLSSLQGCLECLEAVLDLVISNMERSRYHAQHDVRFLGLDVFRYQLVQPAGCYLVVLVFLGLKQLDQVLHRGPEVSSDRQLLQGNHQVSVKYQISLQWIFFLGGGFFPILLELKWIKLRKVGCFQSSLSILYNAYTLGTVNKLLFAWDFNKIPLTSIFFAATQSLIAFHYLCFLHYLQYLILKMSCCTLFAF